jgi:hypothetical protein
MTSKAQPDPMVMSSFIMGHVGMDFLAGKAADDGFWGPTYALIAMTLLAYGVWSLWRRQPWYNLLLLFVPIIGGMKLHEMFDDVAEGRYWLVMSGFFLYLIMYAWLALKIFWF